MPTSPLYIQSLDKGLRVLEAFQHQDALGLHEVALLAGMSKSSAQRMIHTLESLGYVVHDPFIKRYRLGVRAMTLGYAYLEREPLFKNAHAILHRLNQECGESVNLSVPDCHDMVFVMRIHTFRHIPVYMPIGTRIPMAASASGRIFLASLPPADEHAAVEELELIRHTAKSTLDRSHLKSILQEARSAGYAYADEEFYSGDINVAAAIFNSAKQPIAAVNISVPKPRWSLERAKDELAPLVLRAARAIGQG